MGSAWEAYVEINEHVAAVRPDLVAEAKSYSTKPVADFSIFLDAHFPIPGGWSTQTVDTAPQVLKDHYPAK